MKKSLLYFLFILISLRLQAQQSLPKQKFILNGVLSGNNFQEVSLKYFDYSGKYVADLCVLKNGEFSFEGYIKDPTKATLSGISKSQQEPKTNSTDLFLETGEMKVVIAKNNFNQAIVSGSHAQQEFEALNRQEDPIRKAIDSLSLQNSKYYDDMVSAVDEQHSAKLSAIISSDNLLKVHLQKQLNSIEFSYIIAHPGSFIGPCLLLNKYDFIPFDSLKIFYNAWTPEVKNSYYGYFIGTFIHVRETTAIGCIAPDFKTEDINGKTLTLSSYKGKNVILLDFWASWCSPCRALNPHLKELYQKYHAKGFEVIGVSIDNYKEAWLKAIKQDGIDIWPQIPVVKALNSPINFTPGEDDLRYKYEFSTIPFEILIDKNGVIVGTWEGKSDANNEEIDQKLAGLMEQK